MFFGIILLIWTALNAYVFWRIVTLPLVERHLPRRLLIGFAVLLWAAFPVSHSLEDFATGAVGRISGLIGAYWLGIVFLLFVVLLAADLVTGFGFIIKKHALAIRTCAFVTGCALAAIAIVQGARPPVVRSYEVPVAKLPPDRDGTVVVVASDIHLGASSSESWITSAVSEINDQHPDVVILAGDVVEGHREQSNEFLPALRKLSAPLGVWAVNGNHESYGPGHATVPQRGLLENAGFHVLRDQSEEIRPGLVISGVDDLTSRYRHRQNPAEFVRRALADRPAGATIFVSHTPWFADSAAANGAAVMVSGHTHNGQIWPFNYIVRLRYPMMAGRYDVKGMPVFVCRGTGTWGPRMRLWQRSEILRLTLRTGDAQ